jgi:hypothetical protein
MRIEAEEHLGDRLGLGVQLEHAVVALGGQHRGDLFARAAHELGELRSDLRVAAREREDLERQRHQLGVGAEHRLQRGPQQRDEVRRAGGARQLLVQGRHPQLGVAAHDLGQQSLLGAEVVVQQAARDARVARDVVERGAGDAAQRDRRPHRVDDALGLLAAERAVPGRRLHGAPA